MRDLYNKIKYGFQRMFYGVDDTFKWQMDSYLEEYFLPKIKDFCIDQLILRYSDDDRNRVHDKMLLLIEDFEKKNIRGEERNILKVEEASRKMWKYFGANIVHFWN